MAARAHQADSDDDDHQLVVAYLPFRCPSCGRHKPFTFNVRGRIRSHQCQSCGTKYRSWEIDAGQVSNWKGAVPQAARSEEE